MAHSFVHAHSSERSAFEAFGRARPERPTLLIDTYDTEAAVGKLIDLVPALARDGIAIGGVRIDSGDLGKHSKAVRRLLDAAGLKEVTIFASGNLHELRIEAPLAEASPIDGFGVGTSLDASSDVPAIDAVYKLQCDAGVRRRKRSEGKATWPGVKQVVRRLGPDGCIERDAVQLATEPCDGHPLLVACMRGGRRIAPRHTLADSRARHAREISTLPSRLRAFQPADAPMRVDISQGLRALADRVDLSTN